MGREDGQFKKGNKGKPKGAKSQKTAFWDKLGEILINDGAVLFTQNLLELMRSEDVRQRVAGMQMYKDTLEFFKPRLSRVDNNNTGEQIMKILVSYGDTNNNPEISEIRTIEQGEIHDNSGGQENGENI